MSNKAILPIGINDDRITNPKHRLNEAKLFITIKDLPQKAKEELMSMTWEELFAIAADAEGFRRQMSAHDIAIQKFASDEHTFLKLAELVEKRQEYIHELKG